MTGNRIKYMLACAVFASVQTGLSATYNSVQSGDWTSTSTWNTVSLPGSSAAGDVVYVKGHSVTSSAAVAYNLNGLGLLTAGSVLRMQSGSSMTVTGNLTLSYGNLIVDSNASLSHVSGNGYIRIANQGDGQDGAMTINGGTVTSSRAVLIGNAAAKNAQGTLTINSGSFSSALQMILGAGTNSTAKVFLNGGNLEMSYLEFANNGTGQTQSLTVNGGEFVLTTGNQDASLQFADSNAKVWFEDGMITFKGVDSTNDFTAFKTTFNGWVDAGNIDSLSFTDQQLKDQLVFDGTNAVLYSQIPKKSGFLFSLLSKPPPEDLFGPVSLYPVDAAMDALLDPAPPTGMERFYIDGIRFNGGETRLFCYYDEPDGAPPSGGWPGVVLVHGAGDTARYEWVEYWTGKGYAALAIDTVFRLPASANDKWSLREVSPLPGPLLPWGNDPAWNNPSTPDNQYWLYHAVRNVIRANTFLRSRPAVNPDQVGIVGVSWGGIITSHVVGLDSRFAFAIPVYGCGFLHESDGAQGVATFAANPEWDPSVNLGNADLPVFWTSGATDMHFTPEDRFKSKQLSMGSDPESVGYRWSRWFMLPYIPHSGVANYNDTQFPEKINYVRFADAVITSMNANGGVVGDPEFLRLTSQSLGADKAVIQYETETDVSNVTLFYTTSTNIWSGRSWSEIAEGTLLTVNHDSQTVTADIPAKTTAYFINLTEGSGTDAPLTVSSDLFFAE